MSIDLKGQVAIITGAGRGIGRATAMELAGLGAAIVVNDIGTSTTGAGSDSGPAREVVEAIESAGGRAVASLGSVMDFGEVERMVELAEEAFGRVDILVNNAGLSAGGPIWEIDPEIFSQVCASHVVGTFNCTRAVAPGMRTRRSGRIINLVSRAGIVGMAGNVAYGAGKGGVFGLTNVVSRDLAPFGITVNAVNPSATRTRMVTEAIDRMQDQGDADAQEMAEGLLQAMQTPEDVAAMIAALCSEEAAGMTGEIFYVAGREVGLFEPLTLKQMHSASENWTSSALAQRLTEFELHSLDAPYG
ncbi:MAG: SDR family NAD(P)-dependent oxidoreductase [Myxococcota bacterium]|nr:SDR family NAD(P)-dependent oxidoreductase [Myxococcota bacterium]